MRININSKQVVSLVPVVFWILITLLDVFKRLVIYEGELLNYNLVTIAIITPLKIATFSLFYYYTFPNILKNKKRTFNIIAGLIYIALFGIVWASIYSLIGRSESFEESISLYKASLSHTIISTIYALFLRLSVDWVEKDQKQKELEKLKSKLELSLLHSKINPSFLFKTLNDIDQFCITSPAKASFATIKLSEIMRYMLYDTKDGKVLLDKEIEHIQNYISLQKLYYKEANFVTFNTIGRTEGVFIHPMIFFPFVENAFRHGLVNEANNINIRIDISKNNIYFKCENEKKHNPLINNSLHQGIGIENIRERLNLFYPDRHQLIIENDNNKYIVQLNIY